MAIDLDQVLSYQTVKIVTIKDRRLGILHHLFQIGILVYIIVYTIIIKQRYLRTDTPYGSIRVTLREPVNGTWASADTLPYCKQHSPTQGAFTNYDCLYMLGYDIVYPPAPLNSIFITTRIKDTVFTTPTGNPNCTNPATPTSVKCIPQYASESRYYTAGVEDFTIFLEHSVFGQMNNIALTNGKLKGELYFTGREERNILFSGDRAGDIFSIRTMLEAGGIDSLDVLSGLPGAKSLRYDGVLMMVVITYSNRASAPSEYKYNYALKVIPGVDVVAMEPTAVTTTGGTERNRHGVNMLFLVTGTIGMFDFPTLLTTLVSGLVLLKVATTLVDLLLIYVMPDKEKYKNHKYEMTEDFSDIRDARR